MGGNNGERDCVKKGRNWGRSEKISCEEMISVSVEH